MTDAVASFGRQQNFQRKAPPETEIGDMRFTPWSETIRVFPGSPVTDFSRLRIVELTSRAPA